MFPRHYFGRRFFAPRYFPGETVIRPVPRTCVAGTDRTRVTIAATIEDC